MGGGEGDGRGDPDQISEDRGEMGQGELCAIKLEAHCHWFSCSLHDIDIVFFGLYLIQQYGFLLAMFLLDFDIHYHIFTLLLEN